MMTLSNTGMVEWWNIGWNALAIIPLFQRECYANFECRLADGGMISRHNLFIWEVVKAHVATSPKYPETLHYRGDGIFMISGRSINLSKKLKPENL